MAAYWRVYERVVTKKSVTCFKPVTPGDDRQRSVDNHVWQEAAGVLGDQAVVFTNTDP